MSVVSWASQRSVMVSMMGVWCFLKSISSVGSVPKSSMAIIGRCASRFHAMKSAL